MAVSSVRTKLSLDTWFRIMGANPLHTNGIVLTDLENQHCRAPWFQYDWQDSDRISRESVAQAIAAAEEAIEAQLQIFLAPTYTTLEHHTTNRPWQKELVNYNNRDLRGYFQAVQLDRGHLIEFGIEKQETLASGAAIVATDADGDGWKERCTVTVTGVSATLDPCEVKVFYPGLEHEIRPISASRSGTTLTITFPRYQAVKSSLWDALIISENAMIDGDEDANFLTTVDVKRYSTDASNMGNAWWENTQQTLTIFCRGRDNPIQSIAAYDPATYDVASSLWIPNPSCPKQQPDAVYISYLSGLRPNTGCWRGQMPVDWQRTVAYYACSFLDRPVCDCGAFSVLVKKWSDDVSYSGGVEERPVFAYDRNDLNNPLGTSLGAIYAWKRILSFRERYIRTGAA